MSGFNSKRCPVAAEFVVAMREAFGADVRVTYIKENGYEHGNPGGDQEDVGPDRPARSQNPDN